MMFQQKHYYGFSLMETSLSYEIFNSLQNVIVSSSGDITSQLNPFSSSSKTLVSSSIEEQQSQSTEHLSSLRARGSSGEEPPRKKRKRRRRTRNENKIEEKEKQRMNHIAAERNRRSQMNHFLFILKSMMPLSYSQRADQASIIEGTINYLKRQEQLLQSLQANKLIQSPNIFPEFFIFPQYSTTTASSNHHHPEAVVADVEVTMMERHANIKVLTKTKPRLHFKIVNEFYSLGLRILHLNLTTSKDMALLTFCVKVEEDCQLKTTANEVANAVHEVVRKIQKEN